MTTSATPLTAGGAAVAPFTTPSPGSVAGETRKVTCHFVGGRLLCDLGQVPAHTAIQVTLNLPWTYELAGETLTVPMSISSTRSDAAATIASKHATVRVPRRTLVQVEFRRSRIHVKRPHYADAVAIHDVGALPVRRDSVCVAVPKTVKIIKVAHGVARGRQACWAVVKLPAGQERVETITFETTQTRKDRPTPIFPVSAPKKAPKRSESRSN